jgi:hypothetical protein
MAILLRAATVASLLLPLAPLTAQRVAAGPYEDAKAAYQKGDFATAVRLLLQVAETGNAAAQNLLGFMYHDGEGVPRDYVRSYMWFYLASSLYAADSQEFKDARDAMDLTAAAMTADQISEARAMARRCQDQRYKNCG